MAEGYCSKDHRDRETEGMTLASISRQDLTDGWKDGAIRLLVEKLRLEHNFNVRGGLGTPLGSNWQHLSCIADYYRTDYVQSFA